MITWLCHILRNNIPKNLIRIFLKDEEQLKAEAEMAQQGAQEAQATLQPPSEAGGEDTIATGALPPGSEVPIPPMGVGGAGHPAPMPG